MRTSMDLSARFLRAIAYVIRREDELIFFFSSRRRHTICSRDWSSDVCSSDLHSRILRPQAWVVLVWNDRHTDTTPFLVAYEQLLRDFGTDYDQVNHKRIDSVVIRDRKSVV